MLSVEKAQHLLLDGVPALEAQSVPLGQASGRYLSADVIARITQPPADMSAMDGYAILFENLSKPLTVIGESAAGSAFHGAVQGTQAVRIFTGAPVPPGADAILVQEDVEMRDGLLHLIGSGPGRRGAHIRLCGQDFSEGQSVAATGMHVTPALIGIAAAAGHARLNVRRRPRVLVLSLGSELVDPGNTPSRGQIFNSNSPMVCNMLEGADVTDGGTLPDDMASIQKVLERAHGFDVLVTIGGASVGDHDLVRPALNAVGADLEFWRVAMRPGKPVFAGKLGQCRVMGLPGNPVSAFVAVHIFLLPLLRKLAGASCPLPELREAPFAAALPANGARRHYMRAKLAGGKLHPVKSQDSSLFTPLLDANVLAIHPENAAPAEPGTELRYINI